MKKAGYKFMLKALPIALLSLFMSSCQLSGRSIIKNAEKSLMQSDKAMIHDGKKDICVSLEGNGENFSSHFGGFVALLEKGLNPKVVAGGSSGAAVAGIIRLLMTNPTISEGISDDSLNAPQRAARVLAASKGVIESLLFLPSLNDLRNAVGSLAVTLISTQNGLGFISNPDYSLAHAEAITAQLMIAGQFFGEADFSAALAEKDLKKRTQMLTEMYIESYNFMVVTPQEFVNAMMTPESSTNKSENKSENNIEKETSRRSEIRKRYFLLFRSNLTQERTKSAEQLLEDYEKKLSKVGPFANQFVKDNALTIYFRALDTAKTLPFVGALAATVSKPFLMPDSKILQLALEGKNKNGKVIQIPDGAIIHTTARLGEYRRSLPGEDFLFRQSQHSLIENRENKRIDDKPGFDSLYQLYFANDSMIKELRAGREENDGHLLFFERNGKKETPLADKTHTQTVGGLNLIQAITMSVSEPGVFRRLPIEWGALDTGDKKLHSPDLLKPNAFLISYGGWLDTSASQTLSLTKSCAKSEVSHFVYLHPHRLTNDFQKNAMLDTSNFRNVFDFNREKALNDVRVERAFQDLGFYLNQSRAVVGLEPSINLSWNWDKPIDKGNDAQNLSLKQNRPLFLYSAYSAFKIILERGTESVQTDSVFGTQLIDIPQELLNGKSESELSEQIFGSENKPQ